MSSHRDETYTESSVRYLEGTASVTFPPTYLRPSTVRSVGKLSRSALLCAAAVTVVAGCGYIGLNDAAGVDTNAGAIGNEATVDPVADGSRGTTQDVFAADSFWYRALPDDTPTDARSASMVPWLRSVGVEAFGSKSRDLPSTTINTTHYSATIYRTDASDPTVTVSWKDCLNQSPPPPELTEQFTDVRIPHDAVPGRGSDAPISLYDGPTDRYTDLWVADKTELGWTACWGGSIEDASTNPGYFPSPYGATASGLPMEPGAITAAELRDGRIDHVLSMSVPTDAVSDVISWPAQRTDGESDEPLALAEGQRLRLPASIDLDELGLNPTTLTVARAVQEYGVVVVDRSGAFTFHAENPDAMPTDPYPELFGGLDNHSVLWGDPAQGDEPFPFDDLEVLPVDWGQD